MEVWDYMTRKFQKCYIWTTNFFN